MVKVAEGLGPPKNQGESSEEEASMRGFVLAALALAAVVPSSGGGQLTRVDVSLGDVSINKVPQLVAADQGPERHVRPRGQVREEAVPVR